MALRNPDPTGVPDRLDRLVVGEDVPGGKGAAADEDVRMARVIGLECAEARRTSLGPTPFSILARVGTGIGPGTVGLCRELRAAYPDIELIAGGGVRNWDDVDRLGEAGADGVLVASALHEGTITRSR